MLRVMCTLALCAAFVASAAAETNQKTIEQWRVSCDGAVSPSNCTIEQEFKEYGVPGNWARIRVTFDADGEPEAQIILPHTALGDYAYYAAIDGKYKKLPMRCQPDYCEGRPFNALWIRDIGQNPFLWVRYVSERGASIPLPFSVSGLGKAIQYVTGGKV